jgi:hypothetical protein
MRERGEEKLLDLQLFIAPHTKDADRYVRDLQRTLGAITDG